MNVHGSRPRNATRATTAVKASSRPPRPPPRQAASAPATMTAFRRRRCGSRPRGIKQGVENTDADRGDVLRGGTFSRD
ncbi:hypothetical protein GCM10010398_55130 [Streptomyces fimbriatus]